MCCAYKHGKLFNGTMHITIWSAERRCVVQLMKASNDIKIFNINSVVFNLPSVKEITSTISTGVHITDSIRGGGLASVTYRHTAANTHRFTNHNHLHLLCFHFQKCGMVKRNGKETRNVVVFTYRKYVNVRGSHGAECFGVCAGEKGAAVVSLYQPAKLLTEPSRQIRGDGHKAERSGRRGREATS